MAPKVTITQTGREGRVQYSEWSGEIEGYFEFGGNDVLAIISMGSRDEWARRHGWAVSRRAEILRFVADEAIRQSAPSWAAEIDDDTGVILFRARPGAPPPPKPDADGKQAKAAGFVRRYADLRAWVGLVVGVAALIGVGLMWMGKQTISVAPAKGVPLNEAAHYVAEGASGVASLIQATDPHPPNWTGRGGGETVSVKVLLVPLDGAEPSLVQVASGLAPGAIGLARIIGADGRTLWFEASGLYGVRLADKKLVTPKDLQAANPSLDASWWDDPRGMDLVDGRLHVMRRDRSAAIDVDPASWAASPVAPKPSNARFLKASPDDLLAAGLVFPPGVWLGLHTQEELAGPFKPGKWVRPVESADRTKRPRKLSLGAVEPSSGGERFRMRTIAPAGEAEYRDAAFLRPDAKSTPLVVDDPESALMLHTSVPAGTLIVSRVDAKGGVLWTADTGLDRHTLQHMFPDAGTVAFVGSRPPVPGKLSEPLVVLVQTRAGQVTAQTLWR